MAARFDKLEKTRDRIGRVFSKRTKEAVSRGGKRQQHHHQPTASTPTAPQTSTDPLVFPSPSFLRPTTSRMQARDEVKTIVRSARRAQSLPENSCSHARMPSIDQSISATSVTSFYAVPSQPGVPKRSSSLLQRRRHPAVAGLLEFSFSEQRTQARSASVSSSNTEPDSPRRRAARKHTRRLNQLQGPLPIFSARRPDTPPYSDSSNCASPALLPSLINKPLPPTPPTLGVLTPEPSPDLQPIKPEAPNRRPVNSRVTAVMKSQKHRSLEAPITSTVSLRKTVSDSTLSKAVPAAKDNFVLKEPTVETFLSLSDDDIADGPPVTPPMTPVSGRFAPSRLDSGRAPTFNLPPDPPVFQIPSPRSGSKRYSPLICLSSPLTSRPAKIAAFECTRIAQRFNFDLIYIVNLWPEKLGHTPKNSASSMPVPSQVFGSPLRTGRSRAPSSATFDPSRLDGAGRRRSTRSSLTGRLLAGHGLANLQTPFMISSAAHTKILRQDDWVEWRDEVPSQDHFARGYSRAFYAGVSPDAVSQQQLHSARSSVDTKRGSQQQTPQPLAKNRGIVFAAYRFPGPDGTAPRTDPAQLEALYAEAETLVETLLDIHKMERSRRPDAAAAAATTRLPAVAAAVNEYYADEDTGPLPVRPWYEPSLA